MACSNIPSLAIPYALLEWRMQKLDECRPDLEQSMRQFLQLKKQQLEARSRQAFSLKPTNQISHFKQRFNACERALQQQLFQR